MSIVAKVFTRYPRLEVFSRLLYSKTKEWECVKILSKRMLERDVTQKKTVAMSCSIDELFEHIKSYGIHKGDILIVHSSMDHLAQMGMNAKDVIDRLLELVGEEGTLVVPAFPQFSEYEEIDGKKVEVYDVRRTLAWTGMIPNLFLRYKGVVRSEWPCNSLAAKGAKAEEMMKDNLKAKYSQGKGSAWGYCTEHHAKVLFLGVKVFHSLSESHIAEDYMVDADEWPIANWCLEQTYVIKNKDLKKNVTLKKRDPKWASYLIEYHKAERMVRAGYYFDEKYKGLDLGFIDDLYVFNNKKIEDNRKGLLDYMFPTKYLQKK